MTPGTPREVHLAGIGFMLAAIAVFCYLFWLLTHNPANHPHYPTSIDPEALAAYTRKRWLALPPWGLAFGLGLNCLRVYLRPPVAQRNAYAFVYTLAGAGFVIFGTLFMLVSMHVFRPYDAVLTARLDQRRIGVALAKYRDFHGRYPPWSLHANINHAQFAKAPELATLPSFTVINAEAPHLHTLTTPTTYLRQYPKDPFAPAWGATYGYWHSAEGNYGVVWSRGPDCRFELMPDELEAVPESERFSFIAQRQYDPTNGSRSVGDLMLFFRADGN